MTQKDKFSEIQIVRRVISGEKSLYEILVRRFNPYLYKIGRSYNYNHEDTQDLMQDTFVDAYRSLAQFEGRSNFKTWLIRIMMNKCYQKRQKMSYKSETAKEMNENSTPMFSNQDNDTGKVMQARELRHIIETALAKIPHDYRMVFSLREITGLNIAETADLLKISESNVKVRLNRSKTMLRGEIEKSYASEELFEFNLIYCDAIVANVMERI